MKPETLIFMQRIPESKAICWDFFSSPFNLQKITPPEMNFKIVSEFPLGKFVYPGALIAYRVSPIFNITMDWLTEITQVKELEYFIDEQRYGPYSLWHHQHHFLEIEGGVEMTDIVTYSVPYGFIGSLANRLLVKKEINKIFQYRKSKLEELFGTFKPE